MAKKFSLKDNPIFQRLEPPTSPSETTSSPANSETEPNTSEGQVLSLKKFTSEFDPQNLTLRKQVEQSSPSIVSKVPIQVAPAADPPSVDLDLQDHLDKSLFFNFYNEVSDELLPRLEPAAQVLYSRLFRLSYGFNRNHCTVSQSLLMERTGLSRNTVRTTVQSLVENGWIKIIGAGNRVSTSYRVILPREKGKYEKERGAISDPQKKSLKKRASYSEGQNMSLKNSGAISDPPESQFSALPNLTERTTEIINSNSDRNLKDSPSKSAPQNLPPLLRSFTNRSSTLLERASDAQILTSGSLILSARELVEKFYSLLGQRVSRTKKERSIQDCLSLLQEGFAVEEVDYALSWLIQHHPTTGSFSRLVHFIDQALKERATQQHALEIKQHQILAGEQKRAEQERGEREESQLQRRIEEAKANLSPERLTALQEEAQELVRQEHPNVAFGQQILVQIKVDELIKVRYLQ